PARRQCRGDDVFNPGLRFRAAQSWSARWDQGRKPNASVADVDGFPLAERFFLRLHFSAGNHALDFLRPWRALPHPIFHRPDARDHSPRRTFFRILAEPCHPYPDVDPAFCSLRFAVSKEDRLTMLWWMGEPNVSGI